MRAIQHIFVDDGSPESSEYDSNFVSYEPGRAGSYEAAIEEVRRRHARLRPLRSLHRSSRSPQATGNVSSRSGAS